MSHHLIIDGPLGEAGHLVYPEVGLMGEPARPRKIYKRHYCRICLVNPLDAAHRNWCRECTEAFAAWQALWDRIGRQPLCPKEFREDRIALYRLRYLDGAPLFEDPDPADP